MLLNPSTGNSIQMNEVYISGIRGLHSVETAVPYFFRGHYLYDRYCQPLEPLIHSEQISIVLRASTQPAPLYDPHRPELVDEHTLSRAWVADRHEMQRLMAAYQQAHEHDDRNAPFNLVNGDNTTNGERVQTPSAVSYGYGPPSMIHPSTNPSSSLSSTPVYHAPHGHARQMSSSAPPTTTGTPPVPTAPRSQQSTTAMRQGVADQASGRLAPSTNGVSSSGRRSRNRTTRCVHGPDCPGHGTQHLTELSRHQMGFAGAYPALTVPGPGGRFIIDWNALLQEERGRLAMEQRNRGRGWRGGSSR